MWISFVCVGFGAAMGAWLRWGLGVWLNPVWSLLPLGTLTANLTGGFLVGFAVSTFNYHPGLPPELRLLAITGFLGGLTTFSTFSAEVVDMLLHAQYGVATTSALMHLAGSLLLTALGIACARLLLT